MPKSSQESAPKKLERVIVEKTGALNPEDTVQTAGDRMRAAEANAWPVAEGRKLVGVVDQRDPDLQAGSHGHDPQTTRVGDTMRHEAVFCYEDQDAAEADRIMEEHGLNHLPVVDREMRIVGIISRNDVKGEAEAAKSQAAAPAEDWKPGERHTLGLDGHSPDGDHALERLHGLDGSGPENSDGSSGDDGVAAHARFQQSLDGDAERFPFRPPVDAVEADDRR